MHIYSTGMGTGFNPHQQSQHLYQQPTHVTMNINMNMYSNVMNINLKDNPPPNPNAITLSTNTGGNKSAGNTIPDAIRLDANDLKVKKEEPVDMEKKKSWVDDWK